MLLSDGARDTQPAVRALKPHSAGWTMNRSPALPRIPKSRSGGTSAVLPGDAALPKSPAWPWPRLFRRAMEEVPLTLVLIIGVLSHGYHLFQYPLYLTDEGIYLQQAWSVLRLGRLSPYTYFYDHAPAGWLVIAGWVSALPLQFQTFGEAINTGRALMLVMHTASAFLLFRIASYFSKSRLAAFVAVFLFSLSPLAVYYQRQVLLDNLMVFWLLLSLYWATRLDGRILTQILSGLAFGIAILTKENAIFFGPALGYLLYTQMSQRINYRFTLTFWLFSMFSLVSLYSLYALLKGELVPTRLNFDLANPPADHVSLLYTAWWQLNRNQGSVFDRNSLVWQFSFASWLPKDAILLAAGGLATLLNLGLAVVRRERHRGNLAVALLALGYAFYLARGSFMLEFYIAPLIPFLTLNVGQLVGRAHALLHSVSTGRPLRVGLMTIELGAVLLACAVLVFPVGRANGYIFVRDEQGHIVLHDLYRLPLTEMQREQLAFVRGHIPADAKIIIDDELWVDLHDVRPYYKWAHSHWKASADPDVRDRLFGKNWRNIDYLVLSNKMREAMELNNTGGQEDWILEALHHSNQIWAVEQGDIKLEVYQVIK